MFWRRRTKRAGALILLWLIALWLDWRLAVAAAVLASLFFPRFYEIILLGFYYDLIYGPNVSATFILGYPATILALTIFILAEKAKFHLGLKRSIINESPTRSRRNSS